MFEQDCSSCLYYDVCNECLDSCQQFVNVFEDETDEYKLIESGREMFWIEWNQYINGFYERTDEMY